MMINLESLLEELADRVAERLRTTPPASDARLLCIGEAAAYLGRSKQSIYRLIASKALPVVRADRRIFLDREDLDQFISHHKR